MLDKYIETHTSLDDIVESHTHSYTLDGAIDVQVELEERIRELLIGKASVATHLTKWNPQVCHCCNR